MRLNNYCNLCKVNHKTALVSQQLRPRQACVEWPLGLQGLRGDCIQLFRESLSEKVQSRKVLWVVLSSLLFKESWYNDTRGHGHMFASAKGKQQSSFDSYKVRKSILIISHVTFRDCRVHIFSDNLSRNSCISALLYFADLCGSLLFMTCDICQFLLPNPPTPG